MKVLYLLNRIQKDRIAEILEGKINDNHLYGMLRLRKHGIETDYLEIEQYLSERVCVFLRKIFNIYWIHSLLFLKLLKYDIVFTSTAFGTQFLHTLYPFKKPKWVMLDFSITGLLAEERTLRQKIFAYCVRRCDGIVTISEKEASALKEKYPKKAKEIEFIRFAVDTDFFRPQDGIEEKDLIMSPGRDPGRDFKTLFKAVGDRSEKVLITTRPWTLRKYLPLPKNVFHMNLSEKELVRAYAEAKIVIVPLDTKNGVNDAMGCSTIVEAMSMGKAIICTRTPTTESYITNNHNGILVEQGNVEELKNAIFRITEDLTFRRNLKKSARQFAVMNCSADKFAIELTEYFKRLNKSNV